MGGIPDPPPFQTKVSPIQELQHLNQIIHLLINRYRDLNRIDNPDRIRVPRPPVKVSHYKQGVQCKVHPKILLVIELSPTGSGVLNDDQTTKYKVVIEEQQIYSRYPDPLYIENEPTTPRSARGVSMVIFQQLVLFHNMVSFARERERR